MKTLTPSTMNASVVLSNGIFSIVTPNDNLINLGYAIVNFETEEIFWNFQGFSAKRQKAIQKSFLNFAIDSDYLRSI